VTKAGTEVAADPLQKWEHKFFWLRDDADFHCAEKRAKTGDGWIIVRAGTPLQKVRITEAIRNKCNKIFQEYKARTGEGVIYMPLKFRAEQEWFPDDHVVFLSLGALDVAEAAQDAS
tara:strand:+ start:2358 stop:2708 length:351 start_codon:yes stop_codon:yes gene_type:complete